jgi:hypothetical protein
VAAAVPTIGAINTAVANNAPSPNAWVFLGTGNLSNVSTATVSFTAYRKLKIVMKFYANPSNTQVPCLRLNGDSSGIYGEGSTHLISGGTSTQISAGLENNRINLIQNGLNQNQAFIGVIEIENASLTNVKNLSSNIIYRDTSGGTVWKRDLNIYRGTSAITSITIYDTNGVAFQNYVENNTAFQVFGVN